MQRLRQGGLSPEALNERLYWDSMTFDVVKQWRVVHFPITLAFAVLSTGAHRRGVPVLGLEVKAALAHDHHRRQPAGAGGAGLRLPAPDGQPRAAAAGPCRTDDRLLRLPRAAARRFVRALRGLPCRGRHRAAHDEGRDDRPAHGEELVPPGPDRTGLHGLPQRPPRAPADASAAASPSRTRCCAAEVQQRCESCHAAPTDNVHRDLSAANCAQCHAARALEAGHLRPCAARQGRAGAMRELPQAHPPTSCIGK